MFVKNGDFELECNNYLGTLAIVGTISVIYIITDKCLNPLVNRQDLPAVLEKFPKFWGNKKKDDDDEIPNE